MNRMRNSNNALPVKIAQTRIAILFSYYGLLLYFVVNAVTVFGDLRPASVVVWLIQVTPLLIFAPGLHRAHLRTYGWVCFVILLYFMHGVLIAFEAERFWLGLIQITLCSVIFILLIVFIRLYRAHFKVSL